MIYVVVAKESGLQIIFSWNAPNSKYTGLDFSQLLIQSLINYIPQTLSLILPGLISHIHETFNSTENLSILRAANYIEGIKRFT